MEEGIKFDEETAGSQPGSKKPEHRSAVSHWVSLSGWVNRLAFHWVGDSWSHSHCPESPSQHVTQNHPHWYLASGGTGAGRTPTKWLQNAAWICIWIPLRIL